MACHFEYIFLCHYQRILCRKRLSIFNNNNDYDNHLTSMYEDWKVGENFLVLLNLNYENYMHVNSMMILKK